MSKIVLQPAGDPEASAHYIDSIANPTSIDRIARFVDQKTVDRLKELHKEGTVPTWGVTPGKKNVNFKKWQKVQSGDIALFSRDKKIFASAAISFTVHNKELALNLWETNSEGETWEYMYFLDEVKNQDISYEEFNRAAGYEPNYIIRGFNVLDEDKSEMVITNFDLESDVYFPPVSAQEYFDAIKLDPSKILDKEGVVKGRTEQAFLRSTLFHGKKFSLCGICENEYPVAFLVTAHIKKRSNCTDHEKRDFKNIVMPMCKFGCDELYEKGYLGVENGIVFIIQRSDVTESIVSYLEKVRGRKCNFWNVENDKYFKWHLDQSVTKSR